MARASSRVSFLLPLTAGRGWGRCRCNPACAAAGSWSASPSTGGTLRRKRKGYKLRRLAIGCADRYQNELPAIVQIRHWQSRLHTCHWELRDDLSGLLIIGI